jgi:AcrR family transcriptional regulator
VSGFDETRDRILEVAAAQIEAGGEGAIRLRDVALEAGLAEPSLYHYFRNRDALIVAAHAHRFRTNLAVTVNPVVDELRRCTSADHFAETIRGLYRLSFLPDRAAARATRMEILGNAFRRPDLREAVIAAMWESLAPAIEVIRAAQDNGWLRSDISPEVFAYWNLAHISSLSFVEIHDDDALAAEFKQVSIDAADSVVRGTAQHFAI